MEDILAVAPKTPLAQKRLCGCDSRVWLLMDARVWLLMDAVQYGLNFVQGSQSQLWKNEHLHVLKVSLQRRPAHAKPDFN